MPQPSARPTIIDISTAALFMTGSDPGSAHTTGSISVFGSSSKWAGCAAFGTRVNILVRVASSMWISRPTLREDFAIFAVFGSAVVAMRGW
jgi:hypothetical protein